MSKRKWFGKFKKHNKEEAVKMKKSTIIIIEIICAVLIFSVLIGVKYLITNKAKDNVVYLENQLVSNVTFTDFTLTYEKKESDIKVKMINYTQEVINLKKVLIKLYAKDNTKVSEITVNLVNNDTAYINLEKL
jgi:flagellar basal body-associated protein FliL